LPVDLNVNFAARLVQGIVTVGVRRDIFAVDAEALADSKAVVLSIFGISLDTFRIMGG
jgi:hypothetical protein